MNAYKIRENFNCISDTEISKEDFNRYFTKTKERVTFSFNGWDGKSYDGETRTAHVYRASIDGYEGIRFIKVGKGLHYITETKEVLEKATGRLNFGAGWVVDVARA